MRMRKLSEIKIKESYANTTPTEEKMMECRDNWNNYHRQDRYIVVDHEGYLVDGYIQYLVLKENNVEEAEIKIWHCKKKRWYRKNNVNWEAPKYKSEPTVYVFGVHPNSNCTKEFCWRLPNSWKDLGRYIEVGDTLLCQTKFGYSPVVVTRVETLDNPPVEGIVKKVAKREIRRNGAVVELG